MLENKLYQHFTNLLDATIAKTEDLHHDRIYDEYWHLEQVPPSPGKPGYAHDMMVQKGKNIVRQQPILSRGRIESLNIMHHDSHLF